MLPHLNDMLEKASDQYIFRASITIRGVTYFARDYGLKAFRIPVRKH